MTSIAAGSPDLSVEADGIAERGNAPRGVVGRLPEVAAVGTMLALWATGRMVRSVATADNVSYLDIADHWAAGRFGDAVNGYWSPLYSWLLVPFSWADVPSNIAEPVLGLVFMVATIDRLRALCLIVTEPGPGRTLAREVLLVGCVPFLLFTTFRLAGPDQLVAALVLAAFVTLLGGRGDPVRRGVVFGTWSALAFLAKAFALPFLSAVALCWIALAWWRSQAAGFGGPTSAEAATTGTGMHARPAGVGLLVLLGTAAIWSVALSVHYGEPTVSRAATYHAQITAPGAQGNPFAWAGLLQPTHDDAVSAWEDPSVVRGSDGAPVDLAAPGPAASMPDIDGRATRLVKNLNEAMRASALLAGPVVAAVVAVPVVARSLVVRRRRDRKADPEHTYRVAFLLACCAIYVGGISLAIVRARYLWVPMVLTVPVGAWVLGIVQRGRTSSTRALLIASVVLAIGAAARPAVALVRFPENVEEYDQPLLRVADNVEAGARVASLRPDLGYTGACRRADCSYWGAPVATTGDALAAELREAGIDYLVVDGSASAALESTALSGAAVSVDDVGGVTVLDVRGVG